MNQPPADQLPDAFKAASLGDTKTLFQLESHLACSHALASLASQAKHRIHVYTHTMTPLIYDTSILLDAFQQFALTSPRAELRILVEDTRSIVQHCQRLLGLAHKLSSRIDIRKTHPDFTDRLDEFVTFDEIAYLRRPNAEHYAATCCFNGAGQTKALDVFFDAAWQRSETDLELRQMVV